MLWAHYCSVTCRLVTSLLCLCDAGTAQLSGHVGLQVEFSQHTHTHTCCGADSMPPKVCHLSVRVKDGDGHY